MQTAILNPETEYTSIEITNQTTRYALFLPLTLLIYYDDLEYSI